MALTVRLGLAEVLAAHVLAHVDKGCAAPLRAMRLEIFGETTIETEMRPENYGVTYLVIRIPLRHMRQST